MIMRYGLFVLHKSSVFPVTCFLRVMAKNEMILVSLSILLLQNTCERFDTVVVME